jgi:hypothetical protein
LKLRLYLNFMVSRINGVVMREKLQAAIERAFIDLHYAEAELRISEPGENGVRPEIEHIRLAIRELQSAIEPWGGCESSEKPDA